MGLSDSLKVSVVCNVRGTETVILDLLLTYPILQTPRSAPPLFPPIPQVIVALTNCNDPSFALKQSCR